MRKVSSGSADSVFESDRWMPATQGPPTDFQNRRTSVAPLGSRGLKQRVSILPSQTESETRDGLNASLLARRKSTTVNLQSLIQRLSTRRSTHYRRFSSVSTSDRNRLLYEPTYRMEPKARWPHKLVSEAIKSVLEERLKNIKYNAISAGPLTRSISDDVRARVKQLCAEDDVSRRRIVCYVSLGGIIQQKDSGMTLEAGTMVTSRCLWNPETDKQSSYSFKNETLWCNCTVFGVYAD